jgi:hypothetical protein
VCFLNESVLCSKTLSVIKHTSENAGGFNVIPN